MVLKIMLKIVLTKMIPDVNLVSLDTSKPYLTNVKNVKKVLKDYLLDVSLAKKMLKMAKETKFNVLNVETIFNVKFKENQLIPLEKLPEVKLIL